MPESVRDRCTKAHEYLFLLSKNDRYYFDAEAIAQPQSASSIERLSQLGTSNQVGSDRVPGKTNANMKAVGPRFGGSKYGDDDRGESRTKSGNECQGESGRANRRSVWTVATTPYKSAHFATFPAALIEPCVLAGSQPGRRRIRSVLRHGTTGQVAQQLGRRFIGCELNPEYEVLQRDRLRQPPLPPRRIKTSSYAIPESTASFIERRAASAAAAALSNCRRFSGAIGISCRSRPPCKREV
ncbi:DNA methyltransferase [Burkholderia ambifaria]|uniref:DNA methyltransferase n=1 Tax=Burkholderia ambifaria TaxID=152480 RepID=UPI001FC81510|nr:DNA methyltransferase [Burkholderia ambifaria]